MDIYNKIVLKNTPKENKINNYLISFFIGGFIGFLAESLINFYSYVLNTNQGDSTILMIVTLIFFACLFTALGFFDNFVKVAKCGLIIPITGFAHAMASAALDSKSEGLIAGIGANIFKLSGSVIVYGVLSSFIFSIIRILIGVI